MHILTPVLPTDPSGDAASWPRVFCGVSVGSPWEDGGHWPNSSLCRGAWPGFWEMGWQPASPNWPWFDRDDRRGNWRRNEERCRCKNVLWTVQTVMDDSVIQGNGMAGGSKTSEPDKQGEQDPHDLTGNTKLWLGKDYNNFIKRDWVQLDRPFEGTLSKFLSAAHAHTYTDNAWTERWKTCFGVFLLPFPPLLSCQITLIVLQFLACRGVTCLQLFMAKLPGM